jgi:hypothetical protein
MSAVTLLGHRPLRLGLGPFARVAPALLIAAGWLGVTMVVGVVGALSGGRWTVVHLFTLGVLSNLLIAFTQHFARSVTRADGALTGRHMAVLNLGISATLLGMLSHRTAVLAAGAATVTGVVVLSRVRLARMRRSTAVKRFTWVVSTYERAHECFVVAALLGAAMGTGLVPGSWYLSVRLAHLHLNVLGWAGLVVLATVVFFGPAMLRVRLPVTAERRAARSLQAGAGGLLVAALLLVVPAQPGAVGVLLRLGAVAGLAFYAWPVVSVTRSILEMTRRAHPCAARPLLVAAMGWFTAAVIADLAVVAAGAPRLLPVIGLAIGAGVFLQLILAVALYLLPSLRGRGFAARDALIARTERGAILRAVALNVSVLALVLVAAVPGAMPLMATAAWALLLAVVASTAVIAVLPPREDPATARSSVARRYRAMEVA